MALAGKQIKTPFDPSKCFSVNMDAIKRNRQKILEKAKTEAELDRQFSEKKKKSVS